MATVAQAVNPRKLFRFAVLCEGLVTAYAQKCKLPKIEVKSAKHGEGPFFINTPSKVEFSQLELEALKPSESSVAFWKDWFSLLVNLNTGAMATPDVVKKTITVLEFASDGQTIVDTWECQGCYPCDIEMTEMDKLSENNALDKVKFNVDIMTYTGSGDPTMPAFQISN